MKKKIYKGFERNRQILKPGKDSMYELKISWKIKTKLKKTNKHQKHNSRTLHSSKITAI